ncbi:MAG: AI-2E family transporter, partial [Candidatus Aminicenantes bacterium]|nr:AI-2E family transporter [Candidatus Aminicenantes bacterium]
MKKKKFTMPEPLLALILYTAGVLLMILSLKYLTFIAAPFLFSFIIAYLFNPVVNSLESKLRIPRGVSAALLMITLLFLLVFLLVNLVPYMIDEAMVAAVKFPEFLVQFSEKVKIISNYITRNFSEYVGTVDIMGKIEEMIRHMFTNLSRFMSTIFANLFSIILTILYVVFVPLISYYFLKDYRKIKKSVFGLIPLHSKERVLNKIGKLDDLLASFIRGQAIVVLILAVLYSIGLSLIRLPFAILIGIGSGIGDIIPYFGTIVGFVVSIIIGFAHFQSPEKILPIILVFLVVKGSENWFFYPKIVGKEVGLHFVWILVSIIVFGNLFGFWGLLVAIPSSAGFKLFITDLVRYYKNSDFFKREREEARH